MTINNLYMKVSKRENWQLVAPAKQINDESALPYTQHTFDGQDKVESNTLK
jgi:hypothetical protein